MAGAWSDCIVGVIDTYFIYGRLLTNKLVDVAALSVYQFNTIDNYMVDAISDLTARMPMYRGYDNA